MLIHAPQEEEVKTLHEMGSKLKDPGQYITVCNRFKMGVCAEYLLLVFQVHSETSIIKICCIL